MEDGIIYTFGNVDTLVIILEGLAALFDPDQSTFFVSENGLGVGVGGTLAATLALVGVFTTYISEQKLLIVGPLVGLLIYALVAVPKIDRIFVSDLYSGETVAVSDVPLGIAVLGITMSTIAFNMVEETESAYGTTSLSGSPYESSMSQGHGFLSPIKTLYKLRQNLLTAAPSYLVYNIFSYSKYCLHPSAGLVSDGKPAGNPDFDIYSYRRSPNPLTGYFLEPDLIDPDLMSEFMDPVLGSEGFISCGDLNTMLASDAAAGGISFFLDDPGTFGEHLLIQLGSADETMLANCAATGDCLNGNTALTDAKDIMSQVLGGVGQAESYMQVRLAEDFNQMVANSPSMDAESISQAVSVTRETIELVHLTEVLEGETFLHFMVPAMNSILFIFYGTFPLAMIIMITKGTQAFKYLGGYFLIGIWAYSWMPVATIINLITLSNVAEALNTSRNLFGITVQSSPHLLELAMDQLSTGSNLLAATPIVTLVIITGSMFALTSVANSSAAPSSQIGKVASSSTPTSHSPSNLLGLSPANVDADGIKNRGTMNKFASGIASTISISDITSSASVKEGLSQRQQVLSQQFSKTLGNVLQSKLNTDGSRTLSNGQVISADNVSSLTRAGAELFSKAGSNNTAINTTQSDGTNFTAGVLAYLSGGASIGENTPFMDFLQRQQGNPDLASQPPISDPVTGPSTDPRTGPNIDPADNDSKSSKNRTGPNIDPADNDSKNNKSNAKNPKMGRSISGNVGANTGMSYTETDLEALNNLIQSISSTSKSDTVTDIDGNTNGTGLTSSALEGVKVSEGTALSELVQQSETLGQLNSKLDSYSAGKSESEQHSYTDNKTLYDAAKILNTRTGGLPQQFHIDGLESRMESEGFDDDDITAGLNYFKEQQNAIRTNKYAGQYGNDVQYYAGTEAYKPTESHLKSQRDAGKPTQFSSPQVADQFVGILASANDQQFDFLKGDGTHAERSKEIASIKSGIDKQSAAAGSPDTSRVASAVTGAKEVSRSNKMDGQSYPSESAAIINDSTNRTNASTSDYLSSKGFQPNNGLVKDAQTLQDAYFSEDAKNAFAHQYAQEKYGLFTNSDYVGLPTDSDRDKVDNLAMQSAARDVQNWNQQTHGASPENTNLLNSVMGNTQDSSGPMQMNAASNDLASLSRVGVTQSKSNEYAAAGQEAHEQRTEQERLGRLAALNGFGSTNKHGLSASEWQQVFEVARTAESAQEFIQSVNDMKTNALANPVPIGDDDFRTAGATNEVYDQLAKVKPGEGLLSHSVNTLGEYRVLKEHDGVVAQTFDKLGTFTNGLVGVGQKTLETALNGGDMSLGNIVNETLLSDKLGGYGSVQLYARNQVLSEVNDIVSAQPFSVNNMSLRNEINDLNNSIAITPAQQANESNIQGFVRETATDIKNMVGIKGPVGNEQLDPYMDQVNAIFAKYGVKDRL